MATTTSVKRCKTDAKGKDVRGSTGKKIYTKSVDVALPENLTSVEKFVAGAKDRRAARKRADEILCAQLKVMLAQHLRSTVKFEDWTKKDLQAAVTKFNPYETSKRSKKDVPDVIEAQRQLLNRIKTEMGLERTDYTRVETIEHMKNAGLLQRDYKETDIA